MGKEYTMLKKKLQKMESRLIPVLTSPSKPETPPFHQPITDEINQELHFIENLIIAEMASSQAQDPAQAHHYDLGKMARRVRLLKTTLRNWTEALPTSTYVEPGSAPACSYTESCLDDSVDYVGDQDHDHVGEEDSPMAGFKLYDNPEFVNEDDEEEEENGRGGDVYEDEDDQEKVVDYDWIKHVEHEHEHEHEEEEVEGKELIRIDSQMEARSEAAEEDGDDDGTTNNCCYRTVFGVITVVMGITFVLVGFSDYADHPSPLLLVPT